MMKSLSYVIFISILFESVGQVASDLYLPSLPAISSGLHTTTHLVQMTVFLYMVGYSISRLIYGPISDAFGRKNPLIAGLLLSLLGALICVFAKSIGVLIAGRFLQGLGAGAGVIIGSAIVRDLLEGKDLAKTYSYMGLANIVLIASAPFLGGYFQSWFGWRASFIFLTLIAVFGLWVSVFHLKETNQYKSMENLRVSKIKENLVTLITHRSFVAYSICIFMVYGAIIAWLTLGPVWMQNTLGLSPIQFGWVTLVGGVFYASGVFFNSQMVNRYGMNRMLAIGASVITLSGFMLLLFWGLNPASFWFMIIPIMFFIFGASIIFPNAFAGALIPFAKIAGISGAIAGFMQVFGGSIASGIMTLLPNNTPLPLVVAFVLCGAMILFMLCFVNRKPRSI